VKLSALPPSLPALERPSAQGPAVESAPSPSSKISHSKSQKPKVKLFQRVPWTVFSSTFLTIFLAEMGDKTQVATLLMSAESQSPWLVFAGAAMALIATSLVGVLLGRWLATRLSPKTLDMAAGACLLFVSVMLLWDVVHF
jgi:putative Ca2+/H+ antiporter (TMEM165/GDT1 family)